jgi:hypothetical protein
MRKPARTPAAGLPSRPRAVKSDTVMFMFPPVSKQKVSI